MAKCSCGVEMLDHKEDCKFKFLMTRSGKLYRRNTVYFDQNHTCHDCGIPNKQGNTHHVNCDVELCPKCSGQLLSCGCRWRAFST